MPATLVDAEIVPIVGAPLAGGPSTPALAAGVSDAGAVGFLAAGYKTAAAVRRECIEVRRLTSRPIGVNIFCPVDEPVDERALEAYRERMLREGDRYGVVPGEPRWTDDDWTAKLDVVAQERPEVVSFTFGCPDREIVEWLRSCGCRVWCTVTSVAEAKQATAAMVDALVVQGGEAGGHQATFHDHDDPPLPLLDLLRAVASATATPLVAAGGIAGGADVAAAVSAGAVAAQLGTALLRASEAGTSHPYRESLRGERPTRLTRAFTGRRARGVVNRFMLEHDAFAPTGYPQIHHVTAPIRAAARERGDAEAMSLWAGTAYRHAEEGCASDLVERWTRDLMSA